MQSIVFGAIESTDKRLLRMNETLLGYWLLELRRPVDRVEMSVQHRVLCSYWIEKVYPVHLQGILSELNSERICGQDSEVCWQSKLSHEQVLADTVIPS